MSRTPASNDLTSQQISNLTRQTNYGSWRYQQTWKPLHVADAEGCWLTDGAGKRYLDFSSQLMCVNLGHKNPRVVESIAEQARELAYVMPAYATTARARLSAKLLEVLPAGLEKFFFATSGTEAMRRRSRGKLEAMKAKHPSVGDVRGLGLFFAVEIVKDRKT